MAITFHHGAGSPFAWRVFFALEHKRLPYELKILSFSAGDTTRPEFVALNPRHKVPVLVDDGFVIHESTAIVEYLEDRFPDGPALFPRDLRERARCRRLGEEVGSYVGPANQKIAHQLFRKPEPEWDRGELDAGKAALLAELAHFEGELRGEYLCGALSAADFTLYPYLATFARFEKRMPALALRAAVGPGLRGWMKRIEALPYFEKTFPEHWR